MNKKKWAKDRQAIATALSIGIIAIIAIIVIIGAAYVVAASAYGHGTNKKEAIGYLDVAVDLRGAAPLGAHTYFKIENNEGSDPIRATFTRDTSHGLNFLDFMSELGIFDTQVNLKLSITVSSTAGMDDYDYDDETEFTWTLKNGSLTTYRTEYASEPFWISETGLYKITAYIYKDANGDGKVWGLQDTATTTISVG